MLVKKRLCWTLLLVLIPHMASGDQGRFYALYRSSESRCLTVSDVSQFQPGDEIFGGPFELHQAMNVIGEKCPVSFQADGGWFAVSRDEGCWLVKGENRLRAGDVVWDGDIARSLCEGVLLEHCDNFEIDEGASDPGPLEAPVEPVFKSGDDYGWSATTVPWVQVWAPPSSSISTTEVTPNTPPPSKWQVLTPFVAVEPLDASSTPGAVRIELPDSLVPNPEDRARVALGFFEESWSQSGNATDARWRLHGVDHDPVSGTFSTELNHASVVVLLLIGGGLISAAMAPAAYDEAVRKLMEKKASAHFVLHYKANEIPMTTVDFTLNKLEEAHRLLTSGIASGGLGLSYPRVPRKLDVYYMDLGDSGTYGGFRQAKSGARWIDLNLPKKVRGYSRGKLYATIAHELFHFVQFPYEGYSTLEHTWWGKTKEAFGGAEFPYGWLNEALSSWIELRVVTDPSFVFDRNFPIANGDLYRVGLKRMEKAGEGYSVGLFMDFLVRRFGVELVGDILRECSRQVAAGSTADPYVALRRALQRRARGLKPGDRPFGDMNEAWKIFADEFMMERPHSKAIDNRVLRSTPYTAGTSQKLNLGEKATTQTWTVSLPPLSLVPQQSRTFRLETTKRDQDGNALFACSVDFAPAATSDFELSTLLYEYNKRGRLAYLPKNARLLGRLDAASTSTSFTISLRKEDRFKLLSLIPTGLGATAAPSSKAEGAYTLSCSVKEKAEVPDFTGSGVSSNAIENYYRRILQAIPHLRANPGQRLDGVCPECEAMYGAAVSEYKPLRERMINYNRERHAINDEWRGMIRLTNDYYQNIETMHQQMSDADRAGIRNFVEISSAITKALNACSFSPDEYIHPAGLFSKGSFPISPDRLESLARHNKKPLPSAAKLEKEFEYMRNQFSSINACPKALAFIKPFLQERKTEAFRQLQELKARHPALQ